MSVRNLFVQSSHYSLGEIFQRGAALLVVTAYTYFVAPAEYGMVALVTVVAGTSSEVLTLGLQNVIVRFTYDKPEDHSYLTRLYGSIFTLLGCIWGGLLLTSFLVAGPIMDFCDVGSKWYAYVYVGIPFAATFPFYRLHQAMMRANRRSGRYVRNSLAHFLIANSIGVVLVAMAGWGGLGMLVGSLVANVTFCAYAWVVIAREYGFSVDRDLLRSALRYSLPLIPNKFAAFVPELAGKAFLAGTSLAITGVYGIGYRLGETLGSIISGFGLAFQPYYYEQMKAGGDGRARIDLLTRLATLAIASMALLGSLFARELVTAILSPAYHDAWLVVPFAAFTVAFNWLKTLWVLSLTYEKHTTKFVMLGTYAFAVLSVLFIVALLPSYGMVGIAAGVLAARILSSFVMLALGKAKGTFVFRAAALYGMVGVAFLSSLIAYIERPGVLLVKIALATLALLAMAYALRQVLARIREQKSIRRQAVSA